MKMNQLFIIDDDVKLSQVLQAYLEKQGFSVKNYNHPQKGLDALKVEKPDLIILDIMMPDKDGLQVCREIRLNHTIPIIFLSARGESVDKILGLELGADDFLTKPFEPRELVARIHSILRRSLQTEVTKNSILIRDLEINQDSMQAFLNNKDLELTSMEFQALNFIVKNKDKIVSRDDLLNYLQGIDAEVFSRSIDILVSRIRQKLNDNPKSPKYIKTIRGQGYRFIGD
jgi:DNA-binding response OmpR family regulator